MNSLATMLHIAGPAILVIGALAAIAAICAALLFRQRGGQAANGRLKRDDTAETLTGAPLRQRALLNHREADWFAVLDAVVDAAEDRFRLLTQVPFDRVVELAHPAEAGLPRRMRDQRLDFLVIDEESRPVLVACFVGAVGNGSGGLAPEFRQALEQAGVPVIEILPDDADEDIAADAFALLLSADIAQEAS